MQTIHDSIHPQVHINHHQTQAGGRSGIIMPLYACIIPHMPCLTFASLRLARPLHQHRLFCDRLGTATGIKQQTATATPTTLMQADTTIRPPYIHTTTQLKRYEQAAQPASPRALADSLAVLLCPKHTLIPSPNPVQREALQAEV
jgi:hypothetical protein